MCGSGGVAKKLEIGVKVNTFKFIYKFMFNLFCSFTFLPEHLQVKTM